MDGALLLAAGSDCSKKLLDNPDLNIRRTGSSALDLAFVAAGRLNGCLYTQLCSWDMAAGALLVREAGGFATDFLGEEMFLERGNIVATNRKLHNNLLNMVAETN